MKESVVRMEKIPFTMVLHKQIYGVDTIFSTKTGPLVKIPSGKWLGVIRRGIYQADNEDSKRTYEPVSYLWPDVYSSS